MKKYELLMDTPTDKKGSIFTQNPSQNNYYYNNDMAYDSKIVENNPQWFKLVEEKPIGKTEYNFSMEGFNFELGEVIVNGERLFALSDMEKCFYSAREKNPGTYLNELYSSFNNYKEVVLDKK